MRATVGQMALLSGILLGALACGGGQTGLGPGEECTSSSQCGQGLVCDFVASPPACAMMGGIPPDARLEPEADAAPPVDGPDAAPIPDASPLLPDAARPIDAARPDARLPDAPAPVPDAALDAGAA